MQFCLDSFFGIEVIFGVLYCGSVVVFWQVQLLRLSSAFIVSNVFPQKALQLSY